MRIVIDTLVVLMLLCILGGVVLYTRSGRSDTEVREAVRQEVRRFQQQIALQTALNERTVGDQGYPDTIDPQWFTGQLPRNELLGASHPWVGVAPPEQHELFHPPSLVADGPKVAKFWYNPARGIVRARVPTGISDTATLDLYNFINDVELRSLFPGQVE